MSIQDNLDELDETWALPTEQLTHIEEVLTKARNEGIDELSDTLAEMIMETGMVHSHKLKWVGSIKSVADQIKELK